MTTMTSSKASWLAGEIKRRIDETPLHPGTPLGTKAMLFKEYEVSPGTLNEALRLLQVRDYVVVRRGPKGGVFVGQQRQREGLSDALLRAQRHPQEINDLLHIQDALQSLAVMEGATGCDARSAAAIAAAVERLRRASTPREIFLATWEVDRQIAKAGNSHMLTEMYCAIVDMIESSVAGFEVEPALAEGSRKIHEAMAAAVMANDVKAAQLAALLHSPPDGSGPAWRIAIS